MPVKRTHEAELAAGDQEKGEEDAGGLAASLLARLRSPGPRNPLGRKSVPR